MPAAAFQPRNGHWWNPAESGSGYNIDISGNVLVLTVYAYKTNGDSEWYLASGNMSGAQRQFTGTLDKYRNGQCISCAYPGRPALVGNDGTVSLTFQSETAATLVLPGGRVTQIQPFFAPPVDTGKLDGTYQLARTSIDYLGGPLADTASGNIVADGTMVIAGNQLTQTLVVSTAGSAPINLTITGSFVDYGSYLVFTQNGLSNRAIVVARAPLLVTEVLAPAGASSPSYAEVDQWTRVATAAALSRAARAGADGALPLGGAVGYALRQVNR